MIESFSERNEVKSSETSSIVHYKKLFKKEICFVRKILASETVQFTSLRLVVKYRKCEIYHPFYQSYSKFRVCNSLLSLKYLPYLSIRTRTSFFSLQPTKSLNKTIQNVKTARRSFGWKFNFQNHAWLVSVRPAIPSRQIRVDCATMISRQDEFTIRAESEPVTDSFFSPFSVSLPNEMKSASGEKSRREKSDRARIALSGSSTEDKWNHDDQIFYQVLRGDGRSVSIVPQRSAGFAPFNFTHLL